MAGHGKNRHLKLLASPVSWGLGRKKVVWAKKPVAGAHALNESVPLTVLLRDVLGAVDSASQARHVVASGGVLVDGRRVSDDAFGVGLMDVVSLPALNKNYRVVPRGRKLVAVEISSEAAKTKYCRVRGKVSVNKSKAQLNLHDGRNLLIEREEDTFKPGDTLVLSVPKQELKNVLRLSKGAKCLVYKGKHAGEVGEFVELLESKGNKPSNAKLVCGGREVVTLKNYLFVVDEGFGANNK